MLRRCFHRFPVGLSERVHVWIVVTADLGAVIADFRWIAIKWGAGEELFDDEDG